MAYNKIIHLSDLHIRAGDSQLSRSREYKRQFANLLTALEPYNTETTLVVITGDLFEHKHTLGPSGQILAQRLFQGLSEHFTTVVIRGNHDYRQDQPDEPDLIKPFFEQENPNLHYIDETGLYQFGNIEFGIVVVQDTLIRGAKGGINAELPDFPEPSPKSDDIQYRIALFHGTVGGSLLQNGRQVDDRNNYPLRTWIKGYDAILLGDIHVQQIHCAKLVANTNANNNEFLDRDEKLTYQAGSYNFTDDSTNCPWAYAGSLIQQNAGESPWGHGFIVWDLHKKLITGYHLRNETGIIVVGLNELEEPRVKIRVGKKDHNLSIETATSLGWFPRSITLKFNPNARNHVQPILNMFAEAQITVISTGFQEDLQPEQEVLVNETKTNITNDLSNLNSTEEWTRFFAEQNTWSEGEWSQWIKHPHLLSVPTDGFPTEIGQKIQDRNTKFQKTTDLYLNNRDTRPPVRLFRIHHLEFSWLLCFGPKNYVNFDTFIKKVCLINGNNGSGKSSLLEIIGISIFGESFPSRHSRTYSASIINQHKPKEEHAAYTKICFSVDGKKYWIHRTFDPQPANPKNVWQRYIRLIDDETGEILKQNANTVNPWIKEHIGAYEHFLLTTIMTQSSDCDFFSMQGKDQKAIIDSLLQLDVCENFRALLKEAKLNHDYALTHLSSYASGLSNKAINNTTNANTNTNNNVQTYSDRLQMVTEQLIILNTEIANHRTYLAHFPDKLFQYPQSYYEEELQKYTDILESAYSTENSSIDSLKQKHATLKDAFAVLKSRKYSTKQTSKPKPNDTFQTLHAELERLLQKQVPGAPSYDEQAHQLWLQKPQPTPNESNDQTVKEIKRHLKTLQTEFESYDVDEQDFKPVSTKVLAGLEKQDQQLEQELDQISYDIKNAEKELSKIKLSDKDLELLQTYRKATENLTVAFACDYKEAITRMTKAQQILSDKQRIQSELDSMAKELSTIATIKYDPKCKACIENPYKTKKEELLLKQLNLKQQLLTIQTTLDATLITKTPYETLKTLYDTFIAIHSEKTVALSLAKERANTLIGDLTTLKESEKEKLDERDDIQYETLKTVNAYYALKAEIKTIKAQLESAIYYEEQKMWTLSKSAHQLALEINTMKSDVETAYSYEYNETVQALQNIEEQIAKMELLSKAQKSYDSTHDIIEAYPHFTLLKDLEKQYKPLSQEEASLKVRIETAVERQKELEAQQSLNDKVQAFKTYLETRASQVSTMATTFELFTDQLYPLKVGPAIESAVNTVLSYIQLPRPIKLKAVWDSGSFEWYMEDGDSVPPFEKCSGAQKFFAGLALRIAFGRMGASNMINNQLFMDEGFTACDAETMERVPALLKSLLKDLDYMQTIFIVSHLETLKTVADKSIMITRGAQASLLQVGPHVDPPKGQIVKPEEEQKKKGRPKKVVDVN